jgi:hypothetical protein
VGSGCRSSPLDGGTGSDPHQLVFPCQMSGSTPAPAAAKAPEPAKAAEPAKDAKDAKATASAAAPAPAKPASTPKIKTHDIEMTVGFLCRTDLVWRQATVVVAVSLSRC